MRGLCVGGVRCTATRASSAAAEPQPFTAIPRLPALPVVGTLPLYRIGPYSVKYQSASLAAMRRRYGPLVADYRGWGRRLSLHVFEPDDARTVYANEGPHPNIEPLQETAQLYRSLRGMSLGLGNLNGLEWYRLRSAVQQAMMRPDAVRVYFPLVNQVAQDFVQFIAHVRRPDDDGRVPHFRQVVSRWTMETAGLLVFEQRLGALDVEGPRADRAVQLIAANERMFQLSGKLKYSLPVFRFLPTPSWRKLVQTEDYFYRITRGWITEAIDRLRQQSSSSSRSEADLLFMNYLCTRPTLSKEDVNIIAFSLFGDGLSTTSPILVYNLYNLAVNDEVQQRLRAELQQIAEAGLTAEALANAKYLNACIKESFRLYPIGPDVSRITANDVVLSGYHVPAGTPCELNLGPANLDSSNYAEPEQYRPERWLRDSQHYVGRAVHPFILTPFGHGPRMCAGRRFAEQDLRVALYHLLRAFRVGYRGTRPLRQKWESLLLPDGDCPFTFTPLG